GVRGRGRPRDHRRDLPPAPGGDGRRSGGAARPDGRARAGGRHVSARDLLDLAWIVPALPLAGAVVLLPCGRRIGASKAGGLATGLMALAFVASCVLLGALLSLPPDARSHTHQLWTWLPAGTLRVSFGVLADPLSVTWILVVSGVGALIHLYSIGYLHG